MVSADYYLYNGDVSVSTKAHWLCQVLFLCNTLQSVKVPKFEALYDLQRTAAVPNYDLATL